MLNRPIGAWISAIAILAIAAIGVGLGVGGHSVRGWSTGSAASPATATPVRLNADADSRYSGPVPPMIQTATGFSTWDQVISSGLRAVQAAGAHESATMIVTLPDGKQVTLRSGPRVTLSAPATPVETPAP